mmetsp:Transcript_17049/g.53595  ORF Transcript_17049/g.53595 Transcript_17049/m.53595 type:complete len:235 (-) Transcript_17049:144-848(-)
MRFGHGALSRRQPGCPLARAGRRAGRPRGIGPAAARARHGGRNLRRGVLTRAPHLAPRHQGRQCLPHQPGRGAGLRPADGEGRGPGPRAGARRRDDAVHGDLPLHGPRGAHVRALRRALGHFLVRHPPLRGHVRQETVFQPERPTRGGSDLHGHPAGARRHRHRPHRGGVGRHPPYELGRGARGSTHCRLPPRVLGAARAGLLSSPPICTCARRLCALAPALGGVRAPCALPAS